MRPLLAATVAPGKAREKIRYFGPNAEQANVVKLCGNFLIGSAIQAMTESFNLAESYGVDREEVGHGRFFTRTGNKRSIDSKNYKPDHNYNILV